MKILFISTLSFAPQYHCGANTSADQISRGLMAKGHQISFLVSLRPGSFFGFVARIKGKINWRLHGCKAARDTGQGYPVWRAWFPMDAVAHAVKKEKPDVVVVFAGETVRLAQIARTTGVPVCMSLTDVEFRFHGGDFAALGAIACIANSQFTARVYREKFGLAPTVVNPLVRKEKYQTATTRENVTFINPHPEKGPDIVLGMARLCPDIPFALYKTWILSPEQENALLTKMADLPNVKLYDAQDDMKQVYGKCKILLAPSVWEEAYGRVATEAQMSGIPVIASTRGGLPEAVGPGGLLIDIAAPIEEWAKALRKLWDDDKYYAELSAAALAYAQRPEMTPDRQIAAYESALKAATGK